MNFCSLVRYLHTRARASEVPKGTPIGRAINVVSDRLQWGFMGTWGFSQGDDDFPRVQSNNSSEIWAITCNRMVDGFNGARVDGKQNKQT